MGAGVGGGHGSGKVSTHDISIGVRAIIAIQETGIPIEQTLDRLEIAGDPPTEFVGEEFGQAIKALNFSLPSGEHLGGLLLPAVQYQHQHDVELLGVAPFMPDDHGLF